MIKLYQYYPKNSEYEDPTPEIIDELQNGARILNATSVSNVIIYILATNDET